MVTVRCQLGRHPSGHHVREFSRGIVLHCGGILCSTVAACHEVDGVCNECLGELQMDSPGKSWAGQTDTARDWIR